MEELLNIVEILKSNAYFVWCHNSLMKNIELLRDMVVLNIINRRKQIQRFLWFAANEASLFRDVSDRFSTLKIPSNNMTY